VLDFRVAEKRTDGRLLDDVLELLLAEEPFDLFFIDCRCGTLWQRQEKYLRSVCRSLCACGGVGRALGGASPWFPADAP